MSEILGSSFALKRRSLVESAKSVDASLEQLRVVQGAARAKLKQSIVKVDEFRDLYSALAKETAEVCHEIQHARSSDQWSLAFGYLSNYLLGQLATSANGQAQDAIILSIQRLSEATETQFPDRRLVIAPWRRAALAFGSPNDPSPERKPHPHADSLSRMICILRDTGPSIPFREMYCLHSDAIYIVRPA